MVGIIRDMFQVLLVELAGVGIVTGIIYVYWNWMTKNSK